MPGTSVDTERSFVRCPECLRALPHHSLKCPVYKSERRALLRGIAGGSMAATAMALAGIPGLAREVHAVPAPSIGATVQPGSLGDILDYLIYKDGSTVMQLKLADRSQSSYTDSKTAFQAAWSGGGKFVGFIDTHELTAGIGVPAGGGLIGAGQGKSVLKAASTYAATVGAATEALVMNDNNRTNTTIDETGILLANFEVDGNRASRSVPATPESGIGIDRASGVQGTNAVRRVQLENIYVHDVFGHGIHTRLVDRAWIRGCSAFNVGIATQLLWHSYYALRCDRLKIWGFDSLDCLDHDGFKLSNVNFSTVIDAYVKNSGTRGFLLTDLEKCELIGCIADSNQENGFRATNNVKHCLLQGCISYFNKNHGFWLTELTRTDLIGCQAFDNGQALAATYNGFTMEKPVNVNMIGCRANDQQGTQTQQFGVRISDALTNQFRIIGGNFRDNLSSAISIASGLTSANAIYLYQNAGLQPQGVATITVGASPFTYTNDDFVPELVYIRGGTVSQVAKNANNIFQTTNVGVWLDPGEAVEVTYSVIPAMFKDRK